MNKKCLQISSWNTKILLWSSLLSIPFLFGISWVMTQIKNTSSQTLVMIFLMYLLIGGIYLILNKTQYKVEINEHNGLLKYKKKIIFFEKIENYNIYKFILASKKSFILRINYNDTFCLFWFNDIKCMSQMEHIFKNRRKQYTYIDKCMVVSPILYLIIYLCIALIVILVNNQLQIFLKNVIL